MVISRKKNWTDKRIRAFTVECFIAHWAYAIDGAGAIISIGQDILFGVGNDGALKFSINGDALKTEDGAIPIEIWSHVAITRSLDYGETKMYINGTMVGNKKMLDNSLDGIEKMDFRIGQKNGGKKIDGLFAKEAFCGLINELSIYSLSFAVKMIKKLC